VVEKQYADGFPSYSWNQSPFDCFFDYESHGPASAALWRVAANHRDNALLLCPVEHFFRSRPCPLVEGTFQAALLVSMADFTNGLRGQWDDVGNLRRVGALGHLQQRQGAQHDPNLLYAAAQQASKFFLVSRCDIDDQGWTAHSFEYAPKHFCIRMVFRIVLGSQRPRIIHALVR